MLLTLTIISIFVITLVTWIINKFLPLAICPICAGSFLTWVGLLGARTMGYSIDLIVPAILMGGSVVGIAYQIEKRSRVSPGTRMFFKVLFMPAGFVAAYALLEQWWGVLISAAAFLATMSAWALFSHTGRSHEEITGKIEKEMENCC